MSDADYLAMNRHAWDECAKVHFGSICYNVVGLFTGGTALREMERAEWTAVPGGV